MRLYTSHTANMKSATDCSRINSLFLVLMSVYPISSCPQLMLEKLRFPVKNGSYWSKPAQSSTVLNTDNGQTKHIIHDTSNKDVLKSDDFIADIDDSS